MSVTGGGVDLSHLVNQPEQDPQRGAAPGQQHAADVVDVPSVVMDITDQTWEQVVQLSGIVPVVIDLWAEWCGPCKQLSPVIEKLTKEFNGQVVLAKIDVDANPQLAGAFQVQSIPKVVALVGGRPLELFQGALPEEQIRQVFTQLVQLAQQQGVTGRVSAPDIAGGEAAEPQAPTINPEHEKALAALEAGDLQTARDEYEAVVKRNPGDDEAHAALAQVKLLQRLGSKTADEIRQTAASQPDDVEAQMAVADLDVSGGHVEDGFLRLLDLYAKSGEDDRGAVQQRLLELFTVVGHADPRVSAARRKLATLLY